MNQNKSLYFVAIVPTDTIYNQILDWKNYFAENHRSRAALKSPPHITLHMPFRWPEKKEEEVRSVLKELANDHQPFSLQLKDFGAFEPRVIFVDVEENLKLRALQKNIARSMRKSLNVFNDDYKNRGFTPHITVAFRDLKKPEFLKAWEKMQHESFDGSFLVSAIQLLKHDGSRWNIHEQYELRVKA